MECDGVMYDGIWWWNVMVKSNDGMWWWNVMMEYEDGMWWWNVMMECDDGMWWWNVMMECDYEMWWLNFGDRMAWWNVMTECDSGRWWCDVMIECDGGMWWWNVMMECDDWTLEILWRDGMWRRDVIVECDDGMWFQNESKNLKIFVMRRCPALILHMLNASCFDEPSRCLEKSEPSKYHKIAKLVPTLMETYKQSIYHHKQGVYIHVLKINKDDCAIIVW